MTLAIAAERLEVSLGARSVLRAIDLRIAEGDFAILLGGNGSGKTTLVRALLGLIPRASGSITLLDTPLERFASWHRIGYVPQRLALPETVPATVREVVLSGRIARAGLWRPYSRTDRSATDRALEQADLQDIADERVSRLSGGQQQRVLIARALATEPDMILLDEPVSHVDVEHQVHFAELLRDAHTKGATIVLVAHALGVMSGLATRAVVLDDGRVAYDGIPADVPLHDHEVHHHEPEATPALRPIGEER